MLKFAAYLSRSFLITWLTVVFGFLVLIGLLDSLANGADIVASGESFRGTFKYMGLRAPVIFDRIFVFTLVVAILLTYVKLIRQHELVALLGFGISATRQVLLLIPVVFGSALASITLIDYTMAPAVRALQAWGIGEYRVKNITPENPLWLEDSGAIVKATERESYETLANLEIFQRDEKGEVQAIIWADKGTYRGDGWLLSDVRRLEVAGANGEPREAETIDRPMIWTTSQTPTSIARLAAEPRDLSLAEMRNFMQPGNSGANPSFSYAFWHAHRLTRPLAAIILLIACAALMQRTGREDTGDRTLILGITLGFVFLIIDGAMATFAASGGIAVTPAIAMPLLAFGLLAAFLLTRTEAL
ncbi:LptF/LptG family permease [uncultured Algimonas sp.]|uniref:LptF/LptG family permease n=1 Tax=uncultured Algimonas sp. TaxID=1547920 RepID=UPI0026208FBF|nr:LptF/LptG family permease [uncultured Algimonas sp.]